MDHRPGVHGREPRRARDPRDGGQRRSVRRRDRALLLDRGGAGDGLPRRRDDAVLLRRQGQERPRVPAPAVRQIRARVERRQLRGRDRLDRGRQPVRARARRAPDARLDDRHLDLRRRGDRARLHHARRAHVGDLQRGAPVLRRRSEPAATGDRRAALGRRHQRARPPDPPHRARRDGAARVEGARDRPRHQPDRRSLAADGARPRVRARVRLLDNELRRGPARAVGAQHVGRATHAADRRVPEAVLPCADDPPRVDRAGRRSTGSARRAQASSTTPRSRC